MKHDTLAAYGGEPVSSDAVRFDWPRVTPEIEQIVIRQLNETVSIYDNSGVFGEFEEAFANYHGRKHGLLSNSGTSSILAMFDAIGICPGDEILCPVYTFHAAVSPMMSLGAVPIFCDCDDFGNISYDEIVAKTTDKTRAIVVTHMWGDPVADIQKIKAFAEQNDLKLLEDCSHAHGSAIFDQMVGSFGDAAAWSLQGQKTITGGEGGILLTDNKDIFEQSLLHGHYNKRPKKQISETDPLYQFFLTGKGLKLRAHPIAIAMALHGLHGLDALLEVRKRHAALLCSAFEGCNYCQPHYNHEARQSFYALKLKYDHRAAPDGLTKSEFVKILHAEGLVEFDIPGSTGLLNEIPLFLRPDRLFPGLYGDALTPQSGFQNAIKFTEGFIKLPVWSFPDEEPKVRTYFEGICKVLAALG